VLHAFSGTKFPQARWKINPGFMGKIENIVVAPFDRAVSCAPINIARRPGGSPRDMELSRLNALVFMHMSTERVARVIGMRSR
jgi:hypothetical protein